MKKFGLLIFTLLFMIGCDIQPTPYLQGDTILKLKQLKMIPEKYSDTYGSFFLGCGSIRTDHGIETEYYFYTENNKGGINLQKIPYNNVTIYETNKREPSAILRCSNAQYIGVTTLMIFNYNDIEYACNNPKWILYIPENSIYNNINPNIN